MLRLKQVVTLKNVDDAVKDLESFKALIKNSKKEIEHFAASEIAKNIKNELPNTKSRILKDKNWREAMKNGVVVDFDDRNNHFQVHGDKATQPLWHILENGTSSSGNLKKVGQAPNNFMERAMKDSDDAINKKITEKLKKQ